eukprot:1755196-Rhodomonas_salina.2
MPPHSPSTAESPPSHCEIKHKKTQSQCNLYEECVCLHLISGCVIIIIIIIMILWLPAHPRSRNLRLRAFSPPSHRQLGPAHSPPQVPSVAGKPDSDSDSQLVRQVQTSSSS